MFTDMDNFIKNISKRLKYKIWRIKIFFGKMNKNARNVLKEESLYKYNEEK